MKLDGSKKSKVLEVTADQLDTVYLVGAWEREKTGWWPEAQQVRVDVLHAWVERLLAPYL